MNQDLAFSILWEETRGELMKADLYKKKNQMIRDGKQFRQLLKDGTYQGEYTKERIYELKEMQDKHFKKTMFYSGLLKALSKEESRDE